MLARSTPWKVHWLLGVLVVGLGLYWGVNPASAQGTQQPDLFLGSFLVSPTVGPPSGPVDLTVALRNGGKANAGPFNVSVYFSLTPTLDVAKATLLKSIVVSGLGAGQSDLQRITVNIPSQAPINQVAYLAVWIDSGKTVVESNESNNITTATFNVKPGPDLTVDQLKVNKSTPIPGEYITLTYRLRNIGRADVSPFYTYVYFSTDSLIDKQDTLLSSRQTQTLRSGQDSTVNVSIRIPTTAATNKTYYIGVIVDAREERIEENEKNNLAVMTIQVVPPAPKKLPDYVITSMTLKDTSKPLGEYAKFDITIKNQGTAFGYAYVYIYYGLGPRFLTQTSMRVVYRYTIQPGETKTFTDLKFQVPWRAPFNKTPVEYYVEARVSGGTEISTSNNKGPLLKFRALKGKSNIEVSAFTLNPQLCNYVLDKSNKITTPSKVSGYFNLYNRGFEPSQTIRVGIYASADNKITTQDTLLGYIDVPSVSPQSTYSKNYTLNWVGTVITPGTYYLGIVADIRGELTNDYGTGSRSRVLSSRRVQFSSNLPDLKVDSIVVKPASQAAAGTSISVEAVIRNASSHSINNGCEYRFSNGYVSLQFGFYEDSSLRRLRWHSNTYTTQVTQTAKKVTGSFSIPTDVPALSGFVAVKVDYTGFHTESNESNNSRSVPYKLIPREFDFVVNSATIDDSTLVWEKSNKVTMKIGNKGGLTQNYSVNLCVWFSYDKVLDPQDVRLGTGYARNYSRPPYNEGSVTFTTQRWKPGAAFILVQVNCSSYPESNKANNWFYIPISVRKFSVDFVATKIWASPNLIRPSSKTDIFVEVENKGIDKHIKQIVVCIYFSDDNQFDTKDRLYMCRRTTDILGKKGLATLSITGDRSLIAGQRYIVAQLDMPRYGPHCGSGCWYTHPTYEETNENNNISILPIEVKNNVDLTVNSLSVSKTLAKIGENLSFRFQVKNVGAVSTNIPFDIWVVFSDNPTIDNQDRLVKKIRLPILDAGKISSDFTVSYAIPSSVQPGERYFGLLIDPSDEVKESDEKNNGGSVKINVLIPGIDLQLREAKLDNNVVAAGKPVQVQIFSEVQNFGTNASPAFEVGYYLSTDKVFDANDTLLTSRQYKQPLPSTARTGQFLDKVTLTLSASKTANILVVVDPRNQVQEAIETNNIKVLALNVVNRPPRITSLAVTKAIEKQNYLYEAKAFDPDSDPLTWNLLKGPVGMNMDAKTGKLTWVPQPFQGSQSYDVTIEVSDGRGGVVTQSFKVAVQSVNDPPKIVSTPPKRTVSGTQFVYTARAIDPDPNDTISWLKTSGPTGLTIDAKTGEVKWAVPSNIAGTTVTISIQAIDTARASDTQTFQLLVAQQNRPPSITTKPVLVAYEGTTYSYAPKATDPDVGDTQFWSRVAGPTGMNVDSKTGAVSWKVPAGLDGSVVSIRLRVVDQAGAFDEQSFDVAIKKQNTAPTITSKPPSVAWVAVALKYTPKATDPDPGETLKWKLLKGPTNMTFDSKTGAIEWTPTLASLGKKVSFSLSVSDRIGATATQHFDVLVQLRCEVDSDCPTSEICEDSTCMAPGCFKTGCQSPTPVCPNKAVCEADKCNGISCNKGQFCRLGVCVGACDTVTCPSGQKCEDGSCVVDPCAKVQCSPGQRCDSKGKCVRDPCFTGSCRYSRACLGGRCKADLCLQVNCPVGAYCWQGQCLAPKSCQIDVDCPNTQICEKGSCKDPGCLLTQSPCSGGKVCLEQTCKADPCDGVSCKADEFCRRGTCVSVCSGVSCKKDEVCVDGACKSDPCASAICSAGEACVSGTCKPNLCIAGRSCKHGRICYQNSCLDDPCLGIQCPLSTQLCVLGQCLDPPACVLDHECEGQALCVKGRCIPPNCGSSQRCKQGELCVDGACVPNGCDSKTCDKDKVCRGGTCKDSCAGVFCKGKEYCLDGACVADPCAGVTCKEGETCLEGKCEKDRCGAHPNPCKQGRLCTALGCKENPCLESPCPAGQLCDPKTGSCRANLSCKVDSQCPEPAICVGGYCSPPGCYSATCENDTICRAGRCTRNPCTTIKCGVDTYCHSDGSCRPLCNCPQGQRCGANGCEVDPCEGVQCSDGEACLEGVCTTKCPDKACRYNRVCVPGPACVDDPCADVSCPEGSQCQRGSCVDPCMGQSCPDGTECKKGQCVALPDEPEPAPEPEPIDASKENVSPPEPAPEKVIGTTPDETPEIAALPGCDCQANGPPNPWLLLLLLIAFAALRLRRKPASNR